MLQLTLEVRSCGLTVKEATFVAIAAVVSLVVVPPESLTTIRRLKLLPLRE